MFNLAHAGIVRWPLVLTQQVDSAFVDVPVTVAFRVFTRAELREREQKSLTATLAKLSEKVRDKPDVDTLRAALPGIEEADRAEEQILLDRITGWEGFGNAESGEKLPYNRTLGEAVIAHEPHYRALWKGLIDASRQARPKNSSPGADGSATQAPTTAS